MNDEIKEILDRIETASEIFDCLLKPEECTDLLDYITNLQQENEELKKKLDRRYYKNEYERIKQENERLKEENIEMRQCLLIKRRSIPHKLTMNKSIEEILDMPTYEDYKSRCEKAVEYIKKYPTKTWYYLKKNHNKKINPNTDLILCQVELLNILQNGSDSQ